MSDRGAAREILEQRDEDQVGDLTAAGPREAAEARPAQPAKPRLDRVVQAADNAVDPVVEARRVGGRPRVRPQTTQDEEQLDGRLHRRVVEARPGGREPLQMPVQPRTEKLDLVTILAHSDSSALTDGSPVISLRRFGGHLRHRGRAGPRQLRHHEHCLADGERESLAVVGALEEASLPGLSASPSLA